MSILTEVVVYVNTLAPKELRHAIVQPIPEDPRAQSLAQIEMKYAGGSKFFCGYVYAAEFNYTSPGQVLEFLDSLPWEHSDGVAIIESELDLDAGVQVFRFPRGVGADAAGNPPPVQLTREEALAIIARDYPDASDTQIEELVVDLMNAES